MPHVPFAFQWIIPENQLLRLKDSVDGSLHCYPVCVSGVEYYLQIFPNGNNDEHRGRAWAFLQLKLGKLKKIEADYVVAVESANYTRKINKIYDKPQGCGNFCCSTEDLFNLEKKFIVDGKFAIKIYGVFKYEDTVSALAEQRWNGGEVCDKLWKTDDHKDFTIVVGKNEIKVHKLILGTSSAVFSAMFNSNMKESMENKVVITDFSFKTVETAMKIIYNCNCVTTLTMDDSMSLLQFFDKYDLPSLKGKFEELLIGQITSSTVCRLINHSILTNALKLKENCMTFLMGCFTTKTPIAAIDDLDKDVVFKVFKDSLFLTVVQPEQ
uniref:BTB domain-containing protein n=1 Tax=Panagrolaimus sp. PS1159 TaxID=55785 RepID=A0AC35EVA8_9BILA